MRIASSQAILSSSIIDSKSTSVYESLHLWDKNSDSNLSSTSKSTKHRDTLTIKSLSQPVIFAPVKQLQLSTEKNDLKKLQDEFIGGVKTKIMKDMIEMMTGKKIDILDPSALTSDKISTDTTSNPSNVQNATAQQIPQGWGLDYQYKETQYSKQGVTFSASGTITTTHGKSITFDASLEMSREHYHEISVSVKAGDALIDPLMIDISGKGVSFSTEKFSFDIDANGINELIGKPMSGTGFLAYDRNANGIIDTGNELFGPATGNGFGELANLDTDKNGWIDENDAAFEKLSVWQKTDDGSNKLISLKESNVGAIYTGYAKTDFLITNNNSIPNQEKGQVAAVLKNTGFYLKESQEIGFIQEVDMVA